MLWQRVERGGASSRVGPQSDEWLGSHDEPRKADRLLDAYRWGRLPYYVLPGLVSGRPSSSLAYLKGIGDGLKC